MEKRRRGKRALAVVMSFIMAITLLFTNGTMAKAEGNTADQKSIVFTKREANGVTGDIYYQSGEEWVKITDWENGSYTLLLDSSVISVVIRAVPSEGGYISQSNSRIGDRNIDNQDAQNLKSEAGHTVNINDATSINVDIEFDNNPGQTQNPDAPKQYDANTFNFNVTNNLGNGGDVYVKLYNEELDVTSKFASQDRLVAEKNGPEGFLHVICQGEMVGEEWRFTDMSSVPLVVTDGETQVKATAIQILICPKADEQSTFSLSDEVRISKNGNRDGDPGNVRINNNTEDGADNSAYTSFLEGGYLYNLSTDEEDTNAFYEMEFAFVNPEQENQPDNPDQPEPGISDDFTVTIGDTTVYRATVGEEEQDITVPGGAAYDVELIKDQGYTSGIAIKPKRGTDVSGNPDGDISDKTSLTLDPIVVTGNGRVEVHAGLNYEGTTNDSHVEEDVPVVIKASEKTGYSFEAGGDVDFLICWGNFRSTATLEGGVKARGFTLNDMAQLTIGSEQKPVKEAFCAPLRENDDIYESSYVEFNLAKVEIYAEKGFANYNELRAWDEADVNVTLSGADAKMLDNVKCMRVQTGGKFMLKSNSQITYPADFKVKAGYYNEIGEILKISADGRYQEDVKTVGCKEGDHSKNKGEGRYIYSINNDNTEITLESTSKTLWPLGYSFLPDSGDKYVKNGHFEISAGSGLRRMDMTDGGEYFFEKGTEVRFKLVPDTGYQYKEGTFKFNGDGSEKVVTPTNEPGVYIFTMKGNPIHVSCEFEEVDDEIDVKESAKVADANISIPDGAICGTAEFSVKDTTLTPEQNTAFESVAGDKTLGATLDLSMNEVINQIGTDGKTWVTAVTDLKEPMDVSLKLDGGLAGQSEYVVIREHNGKTEELETKYDADTNSVRFATNGYSTYAVAYKEPATPEPPKHKHSLQKTEAKAATCVAAGNKEYWTCSDCKKVYVDAEGKTETTVEKMTIAATGHKWDNGTVTKEATATEAGVKTYHCTNTGCTETKTEPILATGVPEKGTEIKDDKGTASYEVTGSDEKNPTATYTGTTSSTAKTIKIPPTVTVEGITYKVTSIADNAFKGNKTITKVTIPKNVTTIGANAFNGCTKLDTVTLGSSVTSIGANAFKGCKVLTKVTIPSKVTTIGSNAFNGCTKLKTVTVGSSVTSVGTNAFKGCKALTKITLPGKTNKIGANAFNGCTKLKTITIKSKNLTSRSVSSNAFKGISSKATIKVPKGKAKTYKTLFQKKGLSKKVKVQ